MIIRTIIKKSEMKNMKNMRYETEFLMECLLLRIKSATTYDHLAAAKILPLPHPNTILSLLSGMECKFGLNSFALSAIKSNLAGKAKYLRYGSVFFDEIKIKEDVTFDVRKLKFDGFVNFGENGVRITEHEGQLADHVLLIGFRPFRDNWVQPIGAFASKGAATSNTTKELLMRSITALHQHGAEVLSVVCDGCQTNKGVMKLLGCNGGLGTGKHFFSHPLVGDNKIYFLIDVPYLYNCIRNQIFNRKDVQVCSRKRFCKVWQLKEDFVTV